MNQKLDINKVAVVLGVNIHTLRRWDAGGIFKSHRDSPTAHRYYYEDDVGNFLVENYKYLLDLAKRWSFSAKAIDIPSRFFCKDSSIFKARLSKLEVVLGNDPNIKELFSLVTSVVGEIGNNSFDHNLGNWPNTTGIFFGYNQKERKIILADRGQGILTTLKKVRPNLSNDGEALSVAFTEIISGRHPERRGNGLKYVKKIVQNNQMDLWLHSGKNAAIIDDGPNDLSIADTKNSMNGCFVILNY